MGRTKYKIGDKVIINEAGHLYSNWNPMAIHLRAKRWVSLINGYNFLRGMVGVIRNSSLHLIRPREGYVYLVDTSIGEVMMGERGLEKIDEFKYILMG